MDCKDYWKDYIYDLLSCYDDKLSEKQVENVVNRLINNDQFWNAIDEYVLYYIEKEKENS